MSRRYLLLDRGNLVAEIDENSNLTGVGGTEAPAAQCIILLPLVDR